MRSVPAKPKLRHGMRVALGGPGYQDGVEQYTGSKHSEGICLGNLTTGRSLNRFFTGSWTESRVRVLKYSQSSAPSLWDSCANQKLRPRRPWPWCPPSH